MSYCSPNCTNCNLINSGSSIISSSTNLKVFTNIIPGSNCNSQHVIYCLECKECKVQYVGLTTRFFKKRIKEHLYHIFKNDISNFLYNHFNESCKGRKIQFYILDNCSENEDKTILQEKELFWIKLLNTAYPLGLNDNIKGYGNLSNITNPFIYKENHPYYSLSIVKHRTRSIRRNKNKNKTTLQEFIDKANNLDDVLLLYRYIKSLKKAFIRRIIALCFDSNFLCNFGELTKRLLLSILCSFWYNNKTNQINSKKQGKVNIITTSFVA